MDTKSFAELGLNTEKVFGSTDRLGFIFTKDDVTLLISALAKFVSTSSLEPTISLEHDVFAYIRDKAFDNFISNMRHCHELQTRLMDFLEQFD